MLLTDLSDAATACVCLNNATTVIAGDVFNFFAFDRRLFKQRGEVEAARAEGELILNPVQGEKSFFARCRDMALHLRQSRRHWPVAIFNFSLDRVDGGNRDYEGNRIAVKIP